ncbi:MAG: hypothetical protein LBI66_06185 [Burkholderiaceae bacterium]|jgi:hypothetical protein|nr:hypothetical protein [Burkholderiaceae bacterium]
MQASIYQDVIGFQAAGQAHSLGARFLDCSQHRAARLEGIFERVILRFREDLLRCLAQEPPGPARHLRAYVRCVCEHALSRRRGHRTAAQVLTRARFQNIWIDFVDEVCAGDSVDDGIAQQCRSMAEDLWVIHVLVEPMETHRILGIREHLLSLSEQQGSHEPHRVN